MVDYHYIKRGNKLYGPYYYRSYRVGNKVMKEYLGKDYAKIIHARERKINFLPLFFLFVILAGIFFIITFYAGITGRASIQLENTIFLANQPIAGNLNIMLKQGELIPEKTDVIIQIENESYKQTKEMKLKQLVKSSGIDIKSRGGDFYVENTQLSGKGSGYGLEGIKTINPFIYFTIQATATEETGKELLQEVEASVVSGQNFIYEIRNETALSNVNAEILKNSAYYYDEKGKKENLDENVLNIEITSNKIEVTTNYSYQVAGFGQDFINENTTALALNLSALDLAVENSGIYGLKISLSYENTAILQLSANIDIKPSNFTINHGPYLLQNIPNQTMHANTNLSINLADYFADDDNDNLTFTSTQPENLQIIIIGNTAAIIPSQNWVGYKIVKFNASDGINENESNVIEIKVTNTPPTLTRAIPGLNITRDRNETLNLSWYFSDQDNDLLAYSSSNPENMTISIIGDIATITPDFNFVGTRKINFYASDGINSTESNLVSIEVAVSVVNHAPALTSTIPDQTIYSNTEASINLAEYFIDEDGNNLTYNISYAEADNLQLSLDSETGLVKIAPETNFIGNRSIIFSASDGIDTTESNLVQIFVVEKYVERVNHAPKLLQNIPSINIFKNETATLNLSEYFADEDNDALKFTSSKPENITISILNGIATITPDVDFEGNRSIIFYASDNINTTASNSAAIQVTVSIINHAPVLIQNIADIYIKQNQNKTIDISHFFTDADNNKLVFSADSIENIDITITGSLAFIKPDENWIGTKSIIFYASDGIETAASNVLQVNVAENYIPMLATPIPAIVIRENFDYLLNLASFFTQNDDDIIKFTSSSADNIKINIIGSIAKITPDIDFRGIRSITFYASDGIATTPSNLVPIEVKFMNVTEITQQYDAVVGKPVEWIKKIVLDTPENITVKLPIQAVNITVRKIVNEQEQPIAISLATITGAMVKVPAAETYEETKIPFAETISIFRNLFTRATGKTTAITGNAVTGYAVVNENQIAEFQQEVQKLAEAGYKEIQIELAENAKEYEITYQTPAPEIAETEIGAYKKQVTISSALHYQNITAFTELPDIVLLNKSNAISIYWLTKENQTRNITEIIIKDIFNATTNQTERIEESIERSITETLDVRKPVSFIAYDANNNGFIDRIEWQVPSLSNQTYETGITIINVKTYPALHGNWTVYFNTIGEADLKITAVDGTTWTETGICGDKTCQLQFLTLACGSAPLQYIWLKNSEDGSSNSVFYSNYSCSKQGYEESQVLQAAKHTLKFEFGSDVAYAYNDVPGSWYSENASFKIDLLPTLTYVSPTESNNTNFSRTWIAVNVTVSETEQNITFLLYNSTGQVNNTNSTSQLRFVNWTDLPDGNYTYNVSARDSVNNFGAAATRTMLLDSTPPEIVYASQTPANNTNASYTYLNMTVSYNETNFANITFNLYNSTHSLVNSTNYTSRVYSMNWTSLSDGSYYYNVTVEDIVSNKNSTSTRKFTVDTTAPIVNLTSPADNAVISTSTALFTFNVTEALGLINCSLYHNITSWGIAATNTTITPNYGTNLNNSFTISNLADDTSFIWNVKCYDAVGTGAWGESNRTLSINFWYTENVSFKIDRAPVINWTAPANLNTSVFNLTGGFSQSINVTDYSLKEMNCTIYSDSNLTKSMWSVSLNITGNTSYVKTSYVNTSNWKAGTYYEKCTVTDIPF